MTNPGFDEYGEPTGNGGFNALGVIGWRDTGTNTNGLGGVYANGSVPSSPNAAYAAPGQPGAYQITYYSINAGDIITLTYYATNGNGNGTQAFVHLIETTSTVANGATQNAPYSATTIIATSNPSPPATWTQYTLTYTATAGDAGKLLGIEFDGGGSSNGYPNYDSFAVTVPKLPASTPIFDMLNFGDTGSDSASESVHKLNAAYGGTVPVSGVGALSQTYRAPVGGGPGTGTNSLSFTMACSPSLQNYLTVRLWGSDSTPMWLILQGVPESGTTSYGAFDSNNNGGPAPFPNRFYYDTIPVPLAMTQGTTTVTLVLSEIDTPNSTQPARPIYSAYTHTDPHFIPVAGNTGSPLAQSGYVVPATLTASQIVTILEATRQTNYQNTGTPGNPSDYYDAILNRQIPAGQPGAPKEVIGLDLWTNVANWAAANPSATSNQWRESTGINRLPSNREHPFVVQDQIVPLVSA